MDKVAEVLLLVAFIVLAYPGLVLHFTSRAPAMHMDTELTFSIVNWENHFLLREIGLVRHLGFFYPNSFVTYYSEPFFGIGLIIGLIKLLGVNFYAQFNLYVMMGFLIGALGIYKLALELTGQNRVCSFFAAAFYVLLPTHIDLFLWLHLFSVFFVPWILYFLCRFIKTKSLVFLGLFLFFCGLQFVTSVHIGIFLLGFLLPLFLVSGWVFRALPVREVLKIAAGLAILGGILLLVYWPFAVIRPHVDLTQSRTFFPFKLLNVHDLFTSNRSLLYGQALGLGYPALYNWFPGIAVFLLLFLSGLRQAAKKKLLWGACVTAGIISIMVLQKKLLLAAMILFLLLLAFFAFLHLRDRRANPFAAMLAFAMVGYLFIFFNWYALGVPRRLVPFRIIHSHFGLLQGMSEYKRAVVILIPVMAVLAAKGLHVLLVNHKRYLPLTLVFFAVMVVENLRPIEKNWGIRYAEEERAPIYRNIPREGNKVILELPFFGAENVFEKPAFFNNIYTYSQKFHWNFLVNGRSGFFPRDISELAARVAMPAVFNPENIAWLKANYSVDYIIINWRLMDRKEAFLLKNDPGTWACHGDIVQNDRQAAVIRLRDKDPLTSFMRTYSSYHLAHKWIGIRLQENFSGRLDILVNGASSGAIEGGGAKEFYFRASSRCPLSLGGNRLQLRFSCPVTVSEIAILSRNRF